MGRIRDLAYDGRWRLIAVDSNLLVYAHREDSDFHRPALKVLKDLAESGMRWALPWPCLHEFLSITTHPRIFAPPSPLPLALQSIEVWMNSAQCEMIGEDLGYFEVLKRLVTEGRVAGPMIHDAKIAAICIHSGVSELWTADRDFSRFVSLKTRNPLKGT